MCVYGEWRRDCLRVDGTDHTSLAMFGLGTVEPYGLCILDADCVGQDLRCGGDGGVGGHEAGEEGIGLVGHDVLDRHTWVIECGLHNRVVLVIVLIVLAAEAERGFVVPLGGNGTGRDLQVAP